MRKLKVGELIEANVVSNNGGLKLLENGVNGVNDTNLEMAKKLVGEEMEKITVDDLKGIAGEENDDDSTEKNQSEDKKSESAEPAEENTLKQDEKTESEEKVSISKSSFEKLMNKIDNLENQIANKSKDGQVQQVKKGHEMIENRSGKVYGVRFFDVKFLKNSIKNVEVKLSKKDRETDFYGVINGTKSTFKFTAFIIGDNVSVNFNTSNISPKTQKAIFSVLVNKVNKANELLSE